MLPQRTSLLESLTIDQFPGEFFFARVFDNFQVGACSYQKAFISSLYFIDGLVLLWEFVPSQRARIWLVVLTILLDRKTVYG